jgi:hypothetical protein
MLASIMEEIVLSDFIPMPTHKGTDCSINKWTRWRESGKIDRLLHLDSPEVLLTTLPFQLLLQTTWNHSLFRLYRMKRRPRPMKWHPYQVKSHLFIILPLARRLTELHPTVDPLPDLPPIDYLIMIIYTKLH